MAAMEKSVAPFTTSASLHCVSGNILRLIFLAIFVIFAVFNFQQNKSNRFAPRFNFMWARVQKRFCMKVLFFRLSTRNLLYFICAQTNSSICDRRTLFKNIRCFFITCFSVETIVLMLLFYFEISKRNWDTESAAQLHVMKISNCSRNQYAIVNMMHKKEANVSFVRMNTKLEFTHKTF